MNGTEKDEVQKAVAGDEDALALLLGRHGPGVREQVLPTIATKWRTVLDVDDIMQVTYLEAFISIDHFVDKPESSFSGWLKRIAQNNLRDAIRELERQKRPQPENRLQPVSADASAVVLLEDLGFTTTTPSSQAASNEIRLAVESAIACLPEDYSSVVRLYDLEGKPARDVAKEMGRSVGAVYMLRARAHDCLRTSFTADHQFFSRST